MRQATTGDIVQVHYTGTLEDGTVFDSSTDRDPIEIAVGQGQVIAGFDTALMGMAEGEKKSVTLEPESAYGQHDPRLVHTVERTRIPAEIDLAVGHAVQARDDSGNQIRLMVTALNDEQVTLDANHPLAGRNLTFDIELVKFAD